MCQISAMLDKDGRQEKIMEQVTRLEVTAEGIVLRSLFEEPRLLTAVKLKEIDFLGGRLTLVAANAQEET